MSTGGLDSSHYEKWDNSWLEKIEVVLGGVTVHVGWTYELRNLYCSPRVQLCAFPNPYTTHQTGVEVQVGWSWSFARGVTKELDLRTLARAADAVDRCWDPSMRGKAGRKEDCWWWGKQVKWWVVGVRMVVTGDNSERSQGCNQKIGIHRWILSLFGTLVGREQRWILIGTD
jgi:hypothetical protein